LTVDQVTVTIVSMKRKSLSDQIRQAIDDSELSRYEVCNAIGLNQATMSRFMNDKGGLSLATLDKLAELLDFSLTTKPKPKGK
jgi:transcriptional regulator with XRE-family HTH domain